MIITFINLIVLMLYIMSMADKKETYETIGGNERYAVVSLMFGGDKYLPGYEVLVYSLKKHNTSVDTVCMVTDDVPVHAVDKMKSMGVIVKQVPYLEYKFKDTLTEKQKKSYPWMNVSCTKLNCLKLTEYDKILFLDIDVLVVGDINHIFNYNTPASQFETKKKIKPKFKWGKTVSPKNIKMMLDKRVFITDGSLMLLEPKKGQFELYDDMMNRGTFGFKSISGFDEQSITYFYSLYDKGPKKPWVNLGCRYSYNWTMDAKCKSPLILNFLGGHGKKLWMEGSPSTVIKQFPDTLPWYKYQEEMKKIN